MTTPPRSPRRPQSSSSSFLDVFEDASLNMPPTPPDVDMPRGPAMMSRAEDASSAVFARALVPLLESSPAFISVLRQFPIGAFVRVRAAPAYLGRLVGTIGRVIQRRPGGSSSSGRARNVLVRFGPCTNKYQQEREHWLPGGDLVRVERQRERALYASANQ